MMEVRKSGILRTIPLLFTICLLGLPASAQHGVSSNTYVFLTDQSTVVKTGGFAGVHETYPIQGQFQLKVDFNAAVASFGNVDAFLLSPISSSPPQSLGELFNMTELEGTVVNKLLIEFRGKTSDDTNTDIALKLTFDDDAVQLTGQTIPPAGSADFFIFNVNAFAQKKYGGGTGEPNEPYLIYTAEQMNEIGLQEEDWDKHFILMADIDLSGFTGTDFNIIGYYVDWDDNKPFTGVFDGNGKKISNFSYASTNASYVGLFGYVGTWGKEAVIKDLGLIVPNIDAGTGDYVGSLVGNLIKGTITGCYVEGGNVSGDGNVGGLVGNNSFFAYWLDPGFASWGSGRIEDCYAACNVTGTYNVGGLVGDNEQGGIIRNCYSVSQVGGKSNMGGLVGENRGEVTYSFWDIQTSGQLTSDGGLGKTTAEMQDPNTFIDVEWDFMDETANGTEDIWWILEGRHYPRLWWQYGQAFSPHPQDGATDVIQPVILSWLPGGLGLYHEVYFGEDEEAVANATTESPVIFRGRLPVEVTTYDPGMLELDKTYYWRIDEVGEDDPNSPWKGNIWSFTTADFLIVDDFESYNDLDPSDPESNRLWMTWIDGYDSTIFNGSTVSPVEPPFSEQSIVHSGYQSMSFLYDNSGPVIFSLARANIDRLAIDRDWTKSGIKILSLWFYGFPDNAAEPMFVALANAIGMPATVYHVNPDAALINTWTQWNIYLQEFADQGVDLTNINWISIGFDNRNNPQPGGSGMMYFDDIRLYAPAP